MRIVFLNNRDYITSKSLSLKALDSVDRNLINIAEELATKHEI